MANVLVGDADCGVDDVLHIFNETTTQAIMIGEWPKLGVLLDTSSNLMQTLRRDFLVGKIEIQDTIKAMLIDWRSRMSGEATLGALLNIIENFGEWKLLEDRLRQLIIKKAKTWSDLDGHSQKIALKSKVAYEGKIQTLSLLQGPMTKKEFESFLNTQIDQRNIPKLFKSGVVSLGRPKKNIQTSQQESPFLTLSTDPNALALPLSVITGTTPVLTPVMTAAESSDFILKAEAYQPTYQFSIPEPNTITNQSSGKERSLASSTVPDIQVTKYFESPSDIQASTSAATEKIKYFRSDILGIGSGGTNVYKGTFGQRDVAVKVISNFKDVSEAENETKVLLLCDQHENIVRYIHSETTIDGFLIALELCQKFTLADWVDDSTCIHTHIEQLEVLRQATEGLGFLHQLNIIHRDLKPSNILFLIRANDAVVKISDFGISRSISPGRNTRTVTRFGGTSGWTAAEMLEVESILSKSRRSQAKEKLPKMTKKIDIFSLGCIYYFVLTEGEHPFGDKERLRDHLIETDQNVLDTTNFEQYNLRLRCNLSLLGIMIAKNPNIRPDVDYILAHPIFWPHKKMIDFIDEVSNFVNKPTPDNEALCASCVEKLERVYFPQISSNSPDGWFSLLDNTLKLEFTKRYKFHKDQAIKLLRILRNYKHHYHEKDFEPDIKKHIGEMPNEFMTYWLRFFPTLINETRDAFVDLQNKTNFEEYF